MHSALSGFQLEDILFLPNHDKSQYFQAARVLFSPEDRRVPYVRIQTRQLDTLQNMRIVVSIDSWPTDSKYPLVCRKFKASNLMHIMISDINDRDTLFALWAPSETGKQRLKSY
jgi:hypothetical protein